MKKIREKMNSIILYNLTLFKSYFNIYVGGKLCACAYACICVYLHVHVRVRVPSHVHVQPKPEKGIRSPVAGDRFGC